jgi:hypothetical protein
MWQSSKWHRIPIGKIRLTYSIFLSVPTAVFMYLAIANLQWFNPTRVGYLVFGVLAGLLLAILETKTVISRLTKESETIVWHTQVAAGALIGGALVLVWVLFGEAEYAPFGVFAFFPAMLTQLAASGYAFNQFDKENGVQVLGFIYGYKYYVEPNPTGDEHLRYFLQTVASKEASMLWSYIGYSHIFYKKLGRQQFRDSQTQQALLQLLGVMKKYRVIGLTHFVVTMFSSVVLFGVLFRYFDVVVFGIEVPSLIMPTLLALWVSLAVTTYLSMRAVKRNGAQIMATIDSAKLAAA